MAIPSEIYKQNTLSLTLFTGVNCILHCCANYGHCKSMRHVLMQLWYSGCILILDRILIVFINATIIMIPSRHISWRGMAIRHRVRDHECKVKALNHVQLVKYMSTCISVVYSVPSCLFCLCSPHHQSSPFKNHCIKINSDYGYM